MEENRFGRCVRRGGWALIERLKVTQGVFLLGGLSLLLSFCGLLRKKYHMSGQAG